MAISVITGVDPDLQALARSAGLSDAVLRALQGMAVRRTLAPGQCYQLHGDTVQHVVWVVSGSLLIGLADAAGRAHLLRPLGGGFFNLLPALDGGPAIHDAHAGPDTTLLLFPKAAFLELMESCAELRRAVHQMLYARNRQLYAELAQITMLTLRQRCARMLLQVMDPSVEGDGSPRRVQVSQSELALMLGYSRTVVNKELRQLEKDGLIHLTYRRIEIPDVGRLVGVTGGLTYHPGGAA